MTMRQRASFAAHLWKAVTQQHHREMDAVLRPYVPADAVVFDVGAHAGQYAKLFAGMAPRGTVHAFEPSGYARGILERTVKWRRLKNIRVIAAGLSDAPGQLDLSTPLKRKGSFGFGLAHLGDETRFDNVWRETVPIMTADGYVADQALERLDFIKADIEGWEIRMLQGARRTVEKYRPAIYIELVDAFLQRAGDTATAAFDMLMPLEYRAYGLGKEAKLREVDSFDGPDDYLFVPAPVDDGSVIVGPDAAS